MDSRMLDRNGLAVRALLLGVFLLGSAAAVSNAQPWNRKLQFITVLPASGGTGQIVRAVCRLELGAFSAPVNLGTRAEFRRNGATVGSALVPIQVYYSDGFCSDPPCIGRCGSAVLDGGEAALLCYADCYHTDCYCECGVWFTAEVPFDNLQPGDEISVMLFPAPGAQPDPDPSDDLRMLDWNGGVVGWDRSIDQVQLIPVPGQPNRFDVRVAGLVNFDGLPGEWLNLTFRLKLRVDGVDRDSVVIADDVQALDTTCFQLGCGNYCGTHNGILKSCDPILFQGCGCGAGWFTYFNGLYIPSGGNPRIELAIEDANGCLPELNDRNDQFSVLGTSGTGEPVLTPHSRLDQSRPNPFRAGEGGRTATIDFALDSDGSARIDLLDATGRIVRALAAGEWTAGEHVAQWDGRDGEGTTVPGGVYFVRLTVNGETLTRKLLVID